MIDKQQEDAEQQRRKAEAAEALRKSLEREMQAARDRLNELNRKQAEADKNAGEDAKKK